MQMTEKGCFITFEGIDGAGKSSHIDWLSGLLRDAGRMVVQSREPGGTPPGEKLRELLLHDAMCLDTEALLMFAARSEHLAQVVRPALARGDWVVCDRFSDATFAYQCGGRGLSESRFAALENWVHPDLQPDLTFLFDLPPDVAEARMNKQVRTLDRFEQERADFHQRVRAAYLRRAASFPQRFRVIDASRSLDETRQTLEEIVRQCLL